MEHSPREKVSGHEESDAHERRTSGVVKVDEDTAEVVFHTVGAWDFPLSRAEKVRRLLMVFEAEAQGAETEAKVLRSENADLKKQVEAVSNMRVPRPSLWIQPSCAKCKQAQVLPVIGDCAKVARRRSTCTFALPEVDPASSAGDEAVHSASPRPAALQTTPPLPCSSFSPTGSPLAAPGSPVAQTPREPDGRAAPPVVLRQRRRTSIFRLAPEPDDDDPAQGSQPMRAQRRTAPPSAAALVSAQMAGEAEVAAVASMALAEDRRNFQQAVSSFTPPSGMSPASSPANTPRNNSRCRSPIPRCGSPPPPPRSPPFHGLCRSGSAVAGRHSGSVRAVQWCGEQKVNWLRFESHDSSPEWLESAAHFEEESGLHKSGEFILERGETIQAMRGRVEASGCAAAWVILVTSTQRSVTIGCEELSTSQAPSFCFVADAEHEICDVSVGLDGCICDFVQHNAE